MMRKQILQALFYLFIFLFAYCSALPAYAHGGEPRLEISVERVNPGGVVEVRGVEFDYDEPVALSLIRAEIQIPLMEVTADAEGIFAQVIVIPAGLPAGEYNFRAKSEHHDVMSPIITVQGAAILNKEDNGIRDQSDLELGPLPTLVASGVPEKVPQAAAEPTTSNAPPAQNNSIPLIVLSLVGMAVLGLIGARLLRR